MYINKGFERRRETASESAPVPLPIFIALSVYNMLCICICITYIYIYIYYIHTHMSVYVRLECTTVFFCYFLHDCGLWVSSLGGTYDAQGWDSRKLCASRFRPIEKRVQTDQTFPIQEIGRNKYPISELEKAVPDWRLEVADFLIGKAAARSLLAKAWREGLESRSHCFCLSRPTPSPPTKSLGFEGFDSSKLLNLRGANYHIHIIV